MEVILPEQFCMTCGEKLRVKLKTVRSFTPEGEAVVVHYVTFSHPGHFKQLHKIAYKKCLSRDNGKSWKDVTPIQL